MTIRPAAGRSFVARLFLTGLALTGITGCGGGKPDTPTLGVQRAAVTAAVGPELTQQGSPIAKIMAPDNPPTGGGNKDLTIIKTNGMLVTGSGTADQQYDTYTGDPSRTEDWVGYTYGGTQFFGQLLFQDGLRFPDGGWFETIQVQVRQNGVWVPVPAPRFTPSYPTDGSGADFSVYQIDFAPMGGDGIRVFGRPGGSSRFIDVASLRVFGGNPCQGQADEIRPECWSTCGISSKRNIGPLAQQMPSRHSRNGTCRSTGIRSARLPISCEQLVRPGSKLLRGRPTLEGLTLVSKQNRYDALALITMASGHLCLNLSEAVSWEDFPAYANAVLVAVSGMRTRIAEAPDIRLWEVTIDGRALRLVFDDLPPMVSLESADALGDEVLRKLRAQLADA